MPRISTNSRAWVLQRLVLQPILGQADGTPVGEKKLAVSRYEVREASTAPEMAMEPQTAVHGVDHSITQLFEFFKRGRDVGHAAARLVAGDDSGNGGRRNRRGIPHEQRAEVRIGKRIRRGGGPTRRRRLDDHDRVAPCGVELQGI